VSITCHIYTILTAFHLVLNIPRLRHNGVNFNVLVDRQIISATTIHINQATM